MIDKILVPYGPFLEEWKDIVGYEGLYQVSNYGRIKSPSRLMDGVRKLSRTSKEKFLSPANSKGYFIVSLSKKNINRSFRVHRLVAFAFCKNMLNKPWVNHKNGIKSDCFFLNLEWCTESENSIHAFQNKLVSRKGIKNSRSKLTEDDVRKIKILLQKKVKQSEIAELFPVKEGIISKINTGRLWSHLII